MKPTYYIQHHITVFSLVSEPDRISREFYRKSADGRTAQLACILWTEPADTIREQENLNDQIKMVKSSGS